MHGAGKPAGKLLAQAARLALVALLAGSARGCAPSVPHGTHATPSSTSDDAALKARLAAAVRQKGPGYMPRTRHLNADGSPKYNNRLVLESSPYLLQHAHNPVDWFPWGDEAFERAKALNRPVFLSVGYSTCHWCHVMEEESFEDEEIARYLNEHYVPIKVDREERPDVDAVYMTFVQAFTGSGGWPMSVWLTPSREPFFGGTYFPPRAGARGNRAGFLEILHAHAERFTADPAALVEAARDMASRLRSATAPDPSGDFPGVLARHRA
ncbi:MAG: thioredoxin domain-containing protein [Byssovorax sp.]